MILAAGLWFVALAVALVGGIAGVLRHRWQPNVQIWPGRGARSPDLLAVGGMDDPVPVRRRGPRPPFEFPHDVQRHDQHDLRDLPDRADKFTRPSPPRSIRC